MTRIPALAASIAAVLVAASWGCGAALAQPADALPADNPLQRHRDQAASGVTAEAMLRGWVMRADRGSVTVDLLGRRPAQAGFADQDRVVVSIEGRRLRARLLAADTYRQFTLHGSALEGLDVDVLVVSDGDSHLLIVGASEDLGACIGAGPGMPVTIGRR